MRKLAICLMVFGLLFSTACIQQPAKTTTPSTATPIPSSTESGLTPPISKTPTEERKIDLIETPPSSYRLDVKPVFSGHDVCMLGSFAMLSKYNTPQQEFSDIVAYSGLGCSGGYPPQPVSGAQFDFPEGGRWTGLALAARNMGYGLVLGIGKGGRIDEQTKASPAIIAAWPRVQREAISISYFDGVDDAFNYVKRAVASGYPVEVHLNIVLVMNDFAKSSSNWKENSILYTRGGLTEVSHFMVVTGYDTAHVYLNDPTEPDSPVNLSTTLANFKAAWNVQETLTPNNTGPYWMMFLKKNSQMKSVQDILSWNKERSSKTPSSIRILSQNPPKLETYKDRQTIYVFSELRLAYAQFLKKNGKNQAAALYERSSQLWEGLLTSGTMSDDLKKIADLEEQAQGLY